MSEIGVFNPSRLTSEEGLDIIVAALISLASLQIAGASEDEERETLFGALMAAGITPRQIVAAIRRYKERMS